MPKWSEQVEEELTLLLKEWLKAQGRTQADLKKSIRATSTRMPAIIEVLQNEYWKGGLPKVAECLCIVEKDWANTNSTEQNEQEKSINLPTPIDPFDQLDFLLEEIREDCED